MADLLSRLTAALVDRYAVQRKLAHGGMATVYLADDRKHRRQVALKVLNPEYSLAVGTERFLQEIEFAARLQHPHILPIHDSGEADGLVYYVMPFVDGGTLRDRLRSGAPLGVDDALRIASQVTGALQHAHAHKVIHRDVKPENILFVAGHAVLADFGVARGTDATGDGRITVTGTSVGTPSYMSPEQLVGLADERSDVYSLGCVLHEMLTGFPPLPGATAADIMSGYRPDGVAPVASGEPVPEAQAQVIARTVARRGADRYQTAAELRDVLHRLERGEPAPRPADPKATGRLRRAKTARGKTRGGARPARPPASIKATVDATAYRLYLKGRLHWNTRTENGCWAAIDDYKQAIEQDPSWAPAHVGLADAYAMLGMYGWAAPKNVMPKAEAAAVAALKIDRKLPEGYASLGCVRALYHWDWAGAEREFRRAIRLGPEYSIARQWYAIDCLVPLKRFDRAAEQLDQAEALDPLSPIISTTRGLCCYFAGEYDEAVTRLRNTLEVDRRFAPALYFLGQTYVASGRLAEAVSALDRAVKLSRESAATEPGAAPPQASAEMVSALAHACARSGDEGRAESLLAGLIERSKHGYVSPSMIAQVYLGLGNTGEALRWLRQALDVRSSDLAWLGVRPVYDPLRSDPDFRSIITELRVP